MTTIFINGKFLTRKATGVDRYAIEALRAIDNLLSDFPHSKWVLLKPASDFQSSVTFKNIEIRTISPFKGTLWEQVTLPWVARTGKLINLCNSAPVCTRNHLVVIHDAATVKVPQAFSRGFRWWYRVMNTLNLILSKNIGTVSLFSKNEILENFKINRNIIVLKEGADHLQTIEPDFSVIEQHKLIDRPFLLAVGSASPHKNFKTLVQACELVQDNDFDCVIVGGTDPVVFKSTEQLPSWVKHVGYVSDSQLRALYQRAAYFVFPSIYEGYGIPPTEAMAEGCPVIASNSASIPEVCGNDAIYFSAENAVQLAEILGEIPLPAPRHRVMKATWRDAALDILAITQEA